MIILLVSGHRLQQFIRVKDENFSLIGQTFYYCIEMKRINRKRKWSMDAQRYAQEEILPLAFFNYFDSTAEYNRYQLLICVGTYALKNAIFLMMNCIFWIYQLNCKITTNLYILNVWSRIELIFHKDNWYLF